MKRKYIKRTLVHNFKDETMNYEIPMYFNEKGEHIELISEIQKLYKTLNGVSPKGFDFENMTIKNLESFLAGLVVQEAKNL
jgi:hypothetical protein